MGSEGREGGGVAGGGVWWWVEVWWWRGKVHYIMHDNMVSTDYRHAAALQVPEPSHCPSTVMSNQSQHKARQGQRRQESFKR